MTAPSKILVVDDEPDIRLYLVSALEDAGFEVAVPGPDETPEEAIRRHRPRVVSLDIMMPKHSGIAVYRALRADPALHEVRVVVVSGMMLGKDFLHEGFQQLVQDPAVPPPDAFVEKPVQLSTFIETIRRLAAGDLP
jgi:CheY-like chemotaxis protein